MALVCVERIACLRLCLCVYIFACVCLYGCDVLSVHAIHTNSSAWPVYNAPAGTISHRNHRELEHLVW